MKLFSDRRPIKACLALADGTVFYGSGFGHQATVTQPAIGEIVFNTSLYGYQEITTDPSYAGQIMCFTNPQIGNVGCNKKDFDSNKVFVEGIIVKNESSTYSNFRAEQSLSQYLQEAGKMGLSNIDTRLLVQTIRDRGAQMGAMACGENINKDDLIDQAKNAGSMLGKDYVTAVTCKEAYSWKSGLWQIATNSFPEYGEQELQNRPHVVVIDCGVKHNILSHLIDTGFRVTVVPAHSSAQEITSLAPDALFLSNGPGDPAVHDPIVNTIKCFLGKLPIFGICLGHQLLALSAGASTYKLKFGHRGGNHPVLETATGLIEITCQNHGFAVKADGLPEEIEITHINLNDRTIEGLSLTDLNAFSVQYHPEASPGPHDSAYLFKRFFSMLDNNSFKNKNRDICQNAQI